MEIDRKTFKKLFPNLYREMMLKKMSISIDAIRLDQEEAEKEASRPRAPRTPTRRFAPRRRSALPSGWRATWTRTSLRFTNSSGAASWPRRWRWR